eukprot:7390909-Prymnesium_polylepis.1
MDIIRLLSDGGDSLLSAILHAEDGEYEEGAVDFWQVSDAAADCDLASATRCRSRQAPSEQHFVGAEARPHIGRTQTHAFATSAAWMMEMQRLSAHRRTLTGFLESYTRTDTESGREFYTGT